MEQAIKRSRSEEHKRKGSIVKKAILPTFCFAALSTIAFEEAVHAAQTNPTQAQIVSEGTLKYVNVSSGSLNLRTGASTGAAVITVLSKGTAVSVYSETNGWARINVNGKDGYVNSSFLSSTNSIPSSGNPPTLGKTPASAPTADA